MRWPPWSTKEEKRKEAQEARTVVLNLDTAVTRLNYILDKAERQIRAEVLGLEETNGKAHD